MNNAGNGYIYKITCKDLTCPDFYIGATNTPIRRQAQHKYNCSKGKESNRLVYRTIRDNGDWGNWDFTILTTVHSTSAVFLRLMEIFFIKLLKPSLNCHNRYN